VRSVCRAHAALRERVWLLGDASVKLKRRRRRARRYGLEPVPGSLLLPMPAAEKTTWPFWVALAAGVVLWGVLARRKVEEVAQAVTQAEDTIVTEAQQAAQAAGDTIVSAFEAATKLPTAALTYVPMLKASADKYNVSPWLLAGIMMRESAAGTVLKPPGPAGTGDFGKRPPGRQYKQADGSIYTVPASGMPEDGQGWGRGLMQIDWAVHNDWCTNNDWTDPQTNIDFAAEVLAQNFAYFVRAASSAGVKVDAWRLTGLKDGNGKIVVPGWPIQSVGPFPDPRPLAGDALNKAALAAYNAGPSGVLQAIAAGLDPSTPTTGTDYANWIMSRVTGWMAS